MERRRFIKENTHTVQPTSKVETSEIQGFFWTVLNSKFASPQMTWAWITRRRAFHQMNPQAPHRPSPPGTIRSPRPPDRPPGTVASKTA